MEYLVFNPDPRLQPFLSFFWIVKGNEEMAQKVVCDGHSELIFHFQDPYRIKIRDRWQTQYLALVAGQIDRPIMLQPTGISGMLGMKFTPTGLWRLFNWNMKLLKNDAVPLRDFLAYEVGGLQLKLAESISNESRIHLAEKFLLRRLGAVNRKPALDPIVDCIRKTEGQISISSLAQTFKLSKRRMERMFNEQVGVPPKVFARIIRFKKVYQLLQQPNLNTAEVSHLCGYFDQAHLNKDFKTFSGEDPRNYFSGEHPIAKFFLNS
jgi:AraC-like DNA-binding protein